jgi:hypothetical protein
MNSQNDLSEYIKKIMEMYNEKEGEDGGLDSEISAFKENMTFIKNMSEQIIHELRAMGADDSTILFVSAFVVFDHMPAIVPRASIGFILAFVLAIRDEVQRQLHETQTGDNQ